MKQLTSGGVPLLVIVACWLQMSACDLDMTFAVFAGVFIFKLEVWGFSCSVNSVASQHYIIGHSMELHGGSWSSMDLHEPPHPRTSMGTSMELRGGLSPWSSVEVCEGSWRSP